CAHPALAAAHVSILEYIVHEALCPSPISTKAHPLGCRAPPICLPAMTQTRHPHQPVTVSDASESHQEGREPALAAWKARIFGRRPRGLLGLLERPATCPIISSCASVRFPVG